jgi:peptidylprolyl isomerase
MPRLHRWSIAGLSLVALGALGLAGCSSSSSSSTTTTSTASSKAPSTTVATVPVSQPAPAGTWGKEPTVVVPSGAPPTQLQSTDLIVGSGPAAKAGDNVTVQYVLATYSSGKVVQSSWDSQPFQFTLGEGQVIPGWDAGVVGMKVGGRRELIIPPNLGYGNQSPGAGIAANDTLVFVIDMQKIG